MKDSLAGNKIKTSTQKYLDISEIRENTVVMRDNTIRAVIMVGSVNFALKSEDEQNALISAYVSFLNNIDFPLQIVIQSRELNIDGYINNLKVKEKEQTNELLKIQMAEYTQYIGELVSLGKIMNKRFFIVIPYNPLSDKHKGFFSSFTEAFSPVSMVKMKREDFLRRRRELNRRIEGIMGGLTSMGLTAVELDTQGLIELYYNTYNPTTSANQKLVEVDKLRVEV
jgi:hypothetical protein